MCKSSVRTREGSLEETCREAGEPRDGGKVARAGPGRAAWGLEVEGVPQGSHPRPTRSLQRPAGNGHSVLGKAVRSGSVLEVPFRPVELG